MGLSNEIPQGSVSEVKDGISAAISRMANAGQEAVREQLQSLQSKIESGEIVPDGTGVDCVRWGSPLTSMDRPQRAANHGIPTR